MSTLRNLLGSLILLPMVILLWGSSWNLDRKLAPDTAFVLHDPNGTAGIATPPDEHRVFHYNDGLDWTYGLALLPHEAFEVRLSQPVSEFALEVQADFNDSYTVTVSSDGRSYEQIWSVPHGASGSGLSTRTSPRFKLPEGVRFIRVAPLEGDKLYSVAWVGLDLSSRAIPHWMLIPPIWIFWLLLVAAGRWTATRGAADRILRAWARADLWIAAVLIYLVLFRLSVVTAIALGLLCLILVVLAVLKRARLAPALAVVATLVLAVFLVPFAVRKMVEKRISKIHHMTVEHRLLPNPEQNVNSDGIRFAGEASDLKDEDFVVLFAGDSFAYGLFLKYDEAYPYQFEKIVNQSPGPRIRAVSTGWTSSSPLLNLRLLREIGARYKPDLLVYTLDMTDFQDDLRYESALQYGDRKMDPRKASVLARFWETVLPSFNIGEADVESVRRLARFEKQEEENFVTVGGAQVEVPPDPYFITNQPLESSRPLIERGVMRNLGELNQFAAKTLKCPMVLVVVPRAYQYTTRESPKNWEAFCYTPLGPYVREPFRYFEEVRAQLPYKLIDLLPVFESSTEFPLYLDWDPHWTPAGAALAARTVADSLTALGLIPREAPGTPEGRPPLSYRTPE